MILFALLENIIISLMTVHTLSLTYDVEDRIVLLRTSSRQLLLAVSVTYIYNIYVVDYRYCLVIETH